MLRSSRGFPGTGCTELLLKSRPSNELLRHYDHLNSHLDLFRRREGDAGVSADVLGWKYVAEDWDNDWLIFKSGPSEMGVHPTHSEWEGKTYDHPRQHSIAIMCDDIEATVEELRAKGAQFRGPIEEREYAGRIIMMIVPSADRHAALSADAQAGI